MILICTSIMISHVEYPFKCLLAICTSSLEECLFKSFVHFFFLSWIIWGVLWLSCSCLYTLDINLFSNIELANISSHGKYSFPGYLFALLTVSFDAHIFNFDTVQFIYFHFCWLCFWCHIQEIIVKSDIIKLFLFFLLRVS